jgi:hypothetical protein
VRGTHTGEFQGLPPTYRRATIEFITIVRFADGKIVEGWQATDVLSVLQQLGVFPSGPPPRVMRMFVAARGRMQKRRLERERAQT